MPSGRVEGREMFSEEVGSCGFVSVMVSLVMSGESSRMVCEVEISTEETPSSITTSAEKNCERKISLKLESNIHQTTYLSIQQHSWCFVHHSHIHSGVGWHLIHQFPITHSHHDQSLMALIWTGWSSLVEHHLKEVLEVRGCVEGPRLSDEEGRGSEGDCDDVRIS